MYTNSERISVLTVVVDVRRVKGIMFNADESSIGGGRVRVTTILCGCPGWTIKLPCTENYSSSSSSSSSSFYLLK